MRLERLYPLPGEEIRAALQQFPEDAGVDLGPEEPMNQGAYQYISINLPEFPTRTHDRDGFRVPHRSLAGDRLHKAHEAEQAQVVAKAIGA